MCGIYNNKYLQNGEHCVEFFLISNLYSIIFGEKKTSFRIEDGIFGVKVYYQEVLMAFTPQDG